MLSDIPRNVREREGAVTRGCLEMKEFRMGQG